MKSIVTKRTGRKPYRNPDLSAFEVSTANLLCTSDVDGVTEEWEEIDLSTL